MVQCAGNPKPFLIKLASCLLISSVLLGEVSAQAATAVDFPVFRMMDRWMPNLRPLMFQSVLPEKKWKQIAGPDAMSREDRVAVETILLEAAGDGFSSMIAVGETIRNRTELFKRSVSDVCLQPKQFSGWNDPARAENFLKRHQAFYKQAWLAWKLSRATDFSKGATDYHTQDILPYWAAAYSESARVGSHIFYIRQARRIRENLRPVPA